MKPDPILEECYRIKEEYSAQFKDVQALFEHLKEIEAEEKRKGKKYAPPPQYLEFRVTAEHLEFVIGRAKKAGKDMQIVAKPIVGADTREKGEYLASAHLEIRMKRGEIPEGLTQILNRFKV